MKKKSKTAMMEKPPPKDKRKKNRGLSLRVTRVACEKEKKKAGSEGARE
jgi:hypothetical protein